MVYSDSTQPWWRRQGGRYRNFSFMVFFVWLWIFFFIQPLVKYVFIGGVRIIGISEVPHGTVPRTQRFR